VETTLSVEVTVDKIEHSMDEVKPIVGEIKLIVDEVAHVSRKNHMASNVPYPPWL
jgi:hypothetical protein